VSTRRELLRRLGLTAVLTAGMSAMTAIFPEVANAACKYNGCKCASWAHGVYCGGCNAVTNLGSGGAWSHVYLCSGSKSCCDYGPRASCDDFSNPAPCGG
jgi:hypothetical protein